MKCETMAVDTDQYYGRVPKIKMIEERNVRAERVLRY